METTFGRSSGDGDGQENSRGVLSFFFLSSASSIPQLFFFASSSFFSAAFAGSPFFFLFLPPFFAFVCREGKGKEEGDPFSGRKEEGDREGRAIVLHFLQTSSFLLLFCCDRVRGRLSPPPPPQPMTPQPLRCRLPPPPVAHTTGDPSPPPPPPPRARSSAAQDAVITLHQYRTEGTERTGKEKTLLDPPGGRNCLLLFSIQPQFSSPSSFFLLFHFVRPEMKRSSSIFPSPTFAARGIDERRTMG